MSDIKNGDTVIAPEYFDDTPLTFVGMGKTGQGVNDCVVIYKGNAVGIRFKYLIKPDPQ